MDFSWCVVGLGNPGKKYALTRHNAGFWVCDELSRRWGTAFSKKQLGSDTAHVSYNGKKILLVKPQTFMNLSGESVKSITGYYKIHHSQLILVHDDMDTPAGVLRIRKKGRSGGHNGVESVLSLLGTNDIYRVRVGIGRPEDSVTDEINYVLGVVKGEEKKLLLSAVDSACRCVETVIDAGIEKAMTAFNTRHAETES